MNMWNCIHEMEWNEKKMRACIAALFANEKEKKDKSKGLYVSKCSANFLFKFVIVFLIQDCCSLSFL